MPRICAITGKKTAFGNNVSHAKNRVRRQFKVNLAKRRIWVASQNRYIRLTISQHGLRIIEKRGAEPVLRELGLI